MPNDILLGPSGGLGGSDIGYEVPGAGSRLSNIIVGSGIYIDSIQPVYILDGRVYFFPKRGGDGGTLTTITLAPDEFVTGVSGAHGDFIDSMKITTNEREFNFGGRGGDRGYDFQAPTGFAMIGFIGFSGIYIDSIGVAMRPLGT